MSNQMHNFRELNTIVEEFAEQHADQWRGCCKCKESHHETSFCGCGRCYYEARNAGNTHDDEDYGTFGTCACGVDFLWD